jgi:hypothetical protein
VCAGWKRGDSDPELLGTCLNATVSYVPSLSTRIACTACDDIYGAFRWVESNASDAWAAAHGWPADPMWVESNWPAGVPFMQLYLLKPWSERVGCPRGRGGGGWGAHAGTDGEGGGVSVRRAALASGARDLVGADYWVHAQSRRRSAANPSTLAAAGQVGILLAGLCATCVTLAASIAGRRALERHLKQC